MNQIKYTQVFTSKELPAFNDYYFTDKGLLYFYKSDYYTLRGKINFWEDEEQNEVIVKCWFNKSLDLEFELKESLTDLVNLKEEKDSKGKTEYYLENQPNAWNEAKSLIQSVKSKRLK